MNAALFDPAVLFFVFGVGAGLLRSNLQIPEAISKFLSLYLLMAIGLKGGFALAASGFTDEVAHSLALAMALAVITPLLAMLVLRRWTHAWNALAVAATYGSVSAVTFVTALGHLEAQGIAYGGHMMAALALMESPAILLALLWAKRLRQQTQSTESTPAASHALHEALTEGPQLLLLGAMLIGLLTGEAGRAVMQPFAGDLFKGMLAFFLLDMGLLTARHLPSLSGQSPQMVAYALLAPLVHAALALGLASAFGLGLGNTVLLMVLAASASYIAVPAVLRLAVPEADAPLYLGLSLGLTFPFNILIGITLYTDVARWWLG